MLFTARTPQFLAIVQPPETDLAPLPALPGSRVNWLDRFEQGTYRPGHFSRLVSELQGFVGALNLCPHAHSPQAVLTYNQILAAYEVFTKRSVGKVQNALIKGEGLLEVLEPYFSREFKPFERDDADVLFSTACGIPFSHYGQGAGHKFCAIPIRSFVPLIQAMGIKPGDRVLEFGGAGLTAALGSQVTDGHWINFELSLELHNTAVDVTGTFGRAGRAEAVQGNFLMQQWPEANRYYVYEPVTWEDSPWLSGLFAQRAEKGPIQIGLFCKPPNYTSTRDAILKSNVFRVAFESPDGCAMVLEN